jgi:peptidoglycan/LPS O-acetylase OafA/YrhL
MRDRVLDIWRGISVILVIIQHIVFVRYATYFKDTLLVSLSESSSMISRVLFAADKLLIAFALRSGPLGVRIFFVISGFIITKLMIDEEARYGSISIKNFFLRRIFRILPAYIVYLCAISLFGAIHLISLSPSDITAAAGFICNTGLAPCGWNVTHTWSLAVEAQFYILWPLLFALLKPKMRVWFLSTLTLTLVLLSSFGVLIVHTWIDNALSFACITMGALYAQSIVFRSFVQKHGITTVLASAVAILLLSIPAFTVGFAHIAFRAVTPFSIIAIVMAAYRLPALSSSLVGRALSSIGLASYSLYLWQEVFLGMNDNYPRLSFLKFPPLLIAFAVASYFWVEKPVMKWAKKRIDTKVEKVPAL